MTRGSKQVAEQQVLDYLRCNAGEHRQANKMAQAFGVSYNTMWALLDRLADKGVIQRSETGSGKQAEWSVPASGLVPVPEPVKPYKMKEYKGDPIIQARVQDSAERRQAFPSKHV